MPAPADKDGDQPSGFIAQAFAAQCPACHDESMFTGWIAFHDRCPACSFDYNEYNVGDGPAAFLTLIIGALVCAMALTLEFTLYPPFWLHIIIWPIVITVMVIALLRLSKAAMLIEEHRKAFREGRLADDKDIEV